MRLREEKYVAFLNTETTYASYNVPAANDAFLMSNVDINPIAGSVNDRQNYTGFFGGKGKIRSNTYVTFACDIELGGPGAAGSAVPYSKAYLCCAMAENLVASTQAEYTPVEDNIVSGSLDFYADTVYHRIVGFRGTITWTVDMGGIPKLRLEGMGLYTTPSEVAAPVGDTSAYNIPLPANAANVSVFNFYGLSLSMTKLSLAQGNSNEYRNVSNDEAVVMTGRTSTVSLTIEEPEISVINLYDKFNNGEYGALNYQLGTDVTNVGKIFEMQVPRLLITDLKKGKDQGISMLDITCDVVPTAKNMDWKVIHR